MRPNGGISPDRRSVILLSPDRLSKALRMFSDAPDAGADSLIRQDFEPSSDVFEPVERRGDGLAAIR